MPIGTYYTKTKGGYIKHERLKSGSVASFVQKVPKGATVRRKG